MKNKNTLSNSRIKKIMKSAHTPSGPDKDHLRSDCSSWFITIKANHQKTAVRKENRHAEYTKMAAAYTRKLKAKKEAEQHEAQ